MVIVIDDEIVTSSITGLDLKVIDHLGTERSAHAHYHPGRLSFDEMKLDDIISQNFDSILLEFTYYDYIGGRQKVYTYSIGIKKVWLNDPYFILRVYNLDKKRFKKRFNFAKDTNYVYEIDSPCCTFRLVR